jgi:hypothetical protein
LFSKEEESSSELNNHAHPNNHHPSVTLFICSSDIFLILHGYSQLEIACSWPVSIIQAFDGMQITSRQKITVWGGMVVASAEQNNYYLEVPNHLICNLVIIFSHLNW